ncbi:type I restriction enzyme S subunit [Leptospira meyeri]|uniref:Type I restriction enzyme S subunit n=1 Tax=Leptospira meyeri TaxID=29508 RepID=A0A4R8MNG5_LEPME|nr:restriction endonuclease subunit S [Leptospira meyeri]EKJ87473.1 type I restriction modification DNA specificity domain protein [Leptospira meyeri serovar Hardjo str. Went 5]TDY67164.1 type I restriction enzyme S subunit [Leptospira meyeri]
MKQKEKASLTQMVPDLRFPEFSDAGDWVERKFENLFTIGGGRDYKHLKPGSVPMYGSGGYMLSVNEYLHEGESVCIGRKGTIDKPFFLSGRFWTVDTLFYTHSFRESLPKFILFIFQKIKWTDHNETGGIPSLSKTTIGKISVPIPSLPEQQKIADCLSSLDEVLSLESQKLQSLQSYKKGLLQNLFPAEGETVPKLRFPEFEGAGDWEERKLGDVCEFFSGGTPSKENPKFWNGTIPWISASSMHDTFIETSDQMISNFAVSAGARIVPKNSILILIRGSMLYKRVPICINNVEVAFNQDVKALTPILSISLLFMLYQLISKEISLLSLVGSTGIGAGKIDTEDLKAFTVYLPSLSEQQNIADCLSSVDALIQEQSERIERLKSHKKGLLQGLFPVMGE